MSELISSCLDFLQKMGTEMVTLKDLTYLILGVVIGLIAGVAIYWAPLRQFSNEWRAIWSLVSKRYQRGDAITIRAGIELKASPPNEGLVTTHETQVRVRHDEGIGWFHTTSGWKRVRILNVYRETDENIIYKISHLDIKT